MSALQYARPIRKNLVAPGTMVFSFETRLGTVHVLCEHFRGSTNQHAIPNRRTSAKEKALNVVHDDLANHRDDSHNYLACPFKSSFN
jgi:hypothetical protein